MTRVVSVRRLSAPTGATNSDYADAFEIVLAADDPRSAEQWARAGLEHGVRGLPPLIRFIHRRILGFRLEPTASPGSILGWAIASNDHNAITLTADGPLMRGELVGSRTRPDRTQLRTSLSFKRRGAATIWRVVGPIHRRVAPYLLRRAANPQIASPELPRAVLNGALRLRDFADVSAIALVGSWARGSNRADSDVDLLVLTEHPEALLNRDDWYDAFGAGTKLIGSRHFGVIEERRLELPDGLIVEVCVGRPDWAATDPIDEGTATVIRDGIRPLLDPTGLLAKLSNLAALEPRS